MFFRNQQSPGSNVPWRTANLSQCPEFSHLVINHHTFLTKENVTSRTYIHFGFSTRWQMAPHQDSHYLNPARPGCTVGAEMRGLCEWQALLCQTHPPPLSRRPPRPPSSCAPLEWGPPFPGSPPSVPSSPHCFRAQWRSWLVTCVIFFRQQLPHVSWLRAAYGSLEYLPKSLFTPIICREIKLWARILGDLLPQKHFILIL